MKKIFSILVIALIFMLTACGVVNKPSISGDGDEKGRVSSNDINTVEDDQKSSDSSSETEANTSDGGKTLVVYFSNTGNTESIAGHIAKAVTADLYEIVPEESYSSDDLNYSNSDSRSTLEQNDVSARPSIYGSVENMDEYDVVFLGYPIWFGGAPRIISTFMESYDFSGKTIIPFCTSGSSGIGNSATDLHGLCSDTAIWNSGERFSGSADYADVENWVNDLNLR